MVRTIPRVVKQVANKARIPKSLTPHVLRVYGNLAYLVPDFDRPSSSALPGDRRWVISGWKAMASFEKGLLPPGPGALLLVSREVLGWFKKGV